MMWWKALINMAKACAKSKMSLQRCVRKPYEQKGVEHLPAPPFAFAFLGLRPYERPLDYYP